VRADEHPVAAAFVGGLDHEVSQIFQDIFLVGFVGGEAGLDVAQDGFLSEIELDHARHVVNVVQEEIQGGEALDEAALDVFPFFRRDDGGIRSKGKIRSVPSSPL